MISWPNCSLRRRGRRLRFSDLLLTSLPGVHVRVTLKLSWRWQQAGTRDKRHGELLVRSLVRGKCQDLASTLPPDRSESAIGDDLTLACGELQTSDDYPVIVSRVRVRAKLRRRQASMVKEFSELRRRQHLEALATRTRVEVAASLLAEPANALAWFVSQESDHVMNEQGLEFIRALSDSVASARPVLAGSGSSELASGVIQFVSRLRPEQQQSLIRALPELVEMFSLGNSEGS